MERDVRNWRTFDCTHTRTAVAHVDKVTCKFFRVFQGIDICTIRLVIEFDVRDESTCEHQSNLTWMIIVGWVTAARTASDKGVRCGMINNVIQHNLGESLRYNWRWACNASFHKHVSSAKEDNEWTKMQLFHPVVQVSSPNGSRKLFNATCRTSNHGAYLA